MEDCNTVISDCIIISCCCQCLLLQLIIFVFLQLPRQAARKTKEFAKRKLMKRRKKKQGDHEDIMVDDDKQKAVYGNEFVGLDDDDKSGKSTSLRILELECMAMDELHNWGSCDEEVDKVLGELAFKGEFGFGSFWGRNPETQTRNNCYCKCNRSLTKEDELDFGSHVVKFHLIEVIDSFD